MVHRAALLPASQHCCTCLPTQCSLICSALLSRAFRFCLLSQHRPGASRTYHSLSSRLALLSFLDRNRLLACKLYQWAHTVPMGARMKAINHIKKWPSQRLAAERPLRCGDGWQVTDLTACLAINSSHGLQSQPSAASGASVACEASRGGQAAQHGSAAAQLHGAPLPIRRRSARVDHHPTTARRLRGSPSATGQARAAAEVSSHERQAAMAALKLDMSCLDAGVSRQQAAQAAAPAGAFCGAAVDSFPLPAVKDVSWGLGTADRRTWGPRSLPDRLMCGRRRR